MRDLFFLIIIGSAIVAILMSFRLLLKNQPLHGSRISFRNFLVLIAVYITVMAGFGVIYLGLELMGIDVLIEGNELEHDTFLHLVEDVLYFSAVTLMTVGYGDIIPQGIGRWIAMVQALIGYLLPAAFVVTTVIHHDKKAERL
ncbi:two pore domain potassium channel family protein [Bacillus shivajii]|uniref:potassium channel family protein n=1 Tax=Bacillus shivajii TaxID=1983719 RepID=UPI001CFA4688|nr:potassium channel family protein [Bacillus shivajii]UCZ54117.1 two pore domain potassium channel family protein [Bacillus shivajii]